MQCPTNLIKTLCRETVLHYLKLLADMFTLNIYVTNCAIMETMHESAETRKM